MSALPSQDIRFMGRALALARRAGAQVSPNPWVGCVLARGGRVVAEGWHARFGGPHAEAVALARAKKRARGSTAYVNLEPCCHMEKKTPPCAPALIAAGVRRVVVGLKDPNPRVRGKGLRELRKAGIRVTTGVLAAECADLNRPFTIRMARRRPYIILKAAASLDGRIETSQGESQWITSLEARRQSRRMRAEVDAILVGVGTVLKDDPSLTSHGHGKDPLRVVLDSDLRTPRTAKVLDGTVPTLLATSLSRSSLRRAGHTRRNLMRLVPAERKYTLPAGMRPAPRAGKYDLFPRRRFQGNISVLRVPRKGSGLDLRALLKHLFETNVGSVLVEGGSEVHTAFLEEGLVDEVRLFLAPRLIGGSRARGFFEGKGVARLDRTPLLTRVGLRRIGPDILVTGLVAGRPGR